VVIRLAPKASWQERHQFVQRALQRGGAMSSYVSVAGAGPARVLEPPPESRTRRRAQRTKPIATSNIARAFELHRIGDLREIVRLLCLFATGYGLRGCHAERDICLAAAADLLRTLIGEERRRFGEAGLH
jgi:hypothetical protein